MKFFKSFISTLWRKPGHFIAMFIICGLGVSFLAGIGASKPDMHASAEKYFEEQEMHDILLRGAVDDNFLDAVKDAYPSAKTTAFYASDLYIRGESVNVSVRAMGYEDYGEDFLSRPLLTEGRLPEGRGECVVDNLLSQYEVGETITLIQDERDVKAKVVGKVQSPLYIARSRGYTNIGTGQLSGYIYMDAEDSVYLMGGMYPEDIPEGYEVPTIYTALSVKIPGMQDQELFEDGYQEDCRVLSENIKNELEKNDIEAMSETLTENAGFDSYKNDSTRIGNIAQVFPLIFFVVAVLVVITSMTRLVEEERMKCGTLKGLGYSTAKLIAGYCIYPAFLTIIGGVIGLLIGFQVFPPVIINAYGMMYEIPETVLLFLPVEGFLAIFASFASATLATIIAVAREMRNTTAALLRPKPPKSGKRVFAERIGWLWKRLSFMSKVTIRNLFRYKLRFLMSVIGIAACTALIITGFGIEDSVNAITGEQFGKVWLYDVKLTFSSDQMEGVGAAYDAKQNDLVNDGLLIHEQSTTISTDEGTLEGTIVAPRDGFGDFIHLNNYETLRKNERLEPSDDGVILTQKAAKVLGVKVGDRIDLTFGDKDYSVKVDGICENYVYHSVYMSEDFYRSLTGDYPGFNSMLIKLDNAGDSEAYAEEILKNEFVVGAVQSESIQRELMDMSEIMGSIVLVLVTAAGLLSFMVIYNLTNINIDERIRELATIKVLGFYNGELASYIYKENLALTVIGMIAGCVMGIPMHLYVIKAAEIDMAVFPAVIEPRSFLFALGFTLLFSLLVNIIMYPRITKVDMVESLKSYE